MYYYEVWVASLNYHSKENLTYHFSEKMNMGSIVDVELKTEKVNAIIVKNVSKPRFKTKKILQYHDQIGLMPKHLIKLGQWMLNYYPSNIGVITKLILPIFVKNLEAVEETKGLKFKPIAQPPLNVDQKRAIKLMADNGTYLLHGITGSGKTRVYVELIKECLKNNQSVIILVPEIGLTSQLSMVLSKNFDNNFIIDWNSRQASKYKISNWARIINSNEPLIILGPRSALFSPIKNLGLIIIDESHENSYKQESSPFYETARVAGYLSNLLKIKLILASATPSVIDYTLAKSKNNKIINMNNKAVLLSNKIEDKITIVDLKDRSKFIRSKILSEPLIESIKKSLLKNEQILLYLNRRGTSRIIFCTNCGWQSTCPHCDTPLTYHSDTYKLMCHSCDYTSKPPLQCPNCNNIDIIYKSIGTKAVIDEIIKLFPLASYARFDSDNKKIERFENKYNLIIENKISIIVGTQIIAKGLDLPNLSTLGVIIADTSLYLPDYTASERTFQLINQVIGRVGRGHRSTSAIIQTYNPDNKLIGYALNNNYESFYKEELQNRKQFFFPPYCSIVKVSVKRKSQKAVLKVLKDLGDSLINLYSNSIVIEGPTPAYREKVKEFYKWQLIIKSKKRSTLVEIINSLPSNTSYDIDPLNLL